MCVCKKREKGACKRERVSVCEGEKCVCVCVCV